LFGSGGSYDSNGSGSVDVTDLLALLAEYGNACAVHSFPSPCN
jgi:hypothetical protein